MKQKSILKLSTIVLLSVGSLFAQTPTANNDVIIKMPKVPEVPTVMAIVPKVITVDSTGKPITTQSIDDLYPPKKELIFSSRVAPQQYAITQKEVKEEALAGDIKNGRVSAYIHAPMQSVADAKANLTKAGFTVLATYKVDKKGTATSIVFTNEAMEKAATKTMRGFASTLRLVVDKKNKLISISNPIYAMGAFMQKDYNQKLAEDTLKQLRSVFTDTKDSKEIVKFRVLERFHFMENMPFYQDMKVIKKGKNKALLAKAQKSKKVVYEQHLSNGSIVLGVQLGKRTSKFVKKTGYENSGLLPYPVLIENGEAKIMAPQYYIAVMYPYLKMSQFMKIATVPGAIVKDMDRIFR